MGDAGLMFEPHPSNFEKFYNFKDGGMIFWLSQLVSNFQRSVPQFSVHFCSLSLTLCTALYAFTLMHCLHINTYNCTYFWTYFLYYKSEILERPTQCTVIYFRLAFKFSCTCVFTRYFWTVYSFKKKCQMKDFTLVYWLHISKTIPMTKPFHIISFNVNMVQPCKSNIWK